MIALFVAMLAFSTSGVLELVVPEPCSINEATGEEDGNCAPTCIRCNCCGRSIEVVAAAVSVRVNVTTGAFSLPEFVSSASPAEILHVPKRS